MRRQSLVVSTVVSLFASFVSAAPVTVFGPSKYIASPSGANYTAQFANTKDNADGVLTIINGDGKDLTKKDCPKLPLSSKIVCELENALRVVAVATLRPSQIEITLNNKSIISSAQWNPALGKIQAAVKVNKTNNLQIKVKGLWLAFITLDIKADSVSVNQSPVARFSMTPTTGVAPELISFSGITSSDSDGSIVSYSWDFADGQFATGSLVTHNYQNPGTYNIKLTVTDNQGATRVISQSIVIKANQLPTPAFVATTDTALGVLKASFDGSTSKDADGTIQEMTWTFGDQTASVTGSYADANSVQHTYSAPGAYDVVLQVKDNKGGMSTTTQKISVQDATPAVLSLTSPQNGSVLTSSSVAVSGTSNEPLSEVSAQLTGGQISALTLSADKKSFSGSIAIASTGAQVLMLTAKDLAGNASSKTASITVNANIPPSIDLKISTPPSNVVPVMAAFDASKSTSQAGSLKFHFDFGDGSVADNTTGLATHLYESAGAFSFVLTVTDAANVEVTRQAQIVVAPTPVVPNPVVTAPPLAQSGTQPMADGIRFLYTGENPIQTNIQDGALDTSRVAVVRGKVVDGDGSPVSGVKITVQEMPQVGQTLTREDGQFDIVVNGGGTVTVKCERNGYFAVQRKVATSALDFSNASPIVMLRPSETVGKVALNSTQPQAIAAPAVVDNSGARTSVVVIPPTTTAKLQMPDGTMKDVSSLSIRMTEYTVGEKGQDRMPASLPGGTSYTYAIELSADEAIANGAEHVVFSSPIPYYVDNFLNFPVGVAVPVGFLNRKTGNWEPEDDGLVVKVLSIQNGQAVVAVDTTGQPATAQALTSLGFTTEELQKISQLYGAGKSFWRARIKHFSALDLNWLATPRTNTQNNSKNPFKTGVAECNCSSKATGSIIDINQQALGESINVVGAPFDLIYTSLSKPGRSAARTFTVPLIPERVDSSAGILNVHIKYEIAGRVYEESFAPKDNLVSEWTWDGKDAYGREVKDARNATVTVDYEVGTQYMVAPYDPNQKSFGFFSGTGQSSTVQGRANDKVSRTFTVPLGDEVFDASKGVGGWNIDLVHHYDPFARKLYLGTGEVIDGVQQGPILGTVAGGSAQGFAGDGDLATSAQFSSPGQIATGADGGIYIVDTQNFRIRRIDSDGYIQTVIGTGVSGASADGALAVNSQIGSVGGLAVAADGTLYFASTSENKIKKISGGIVTTVAGTGVAGFSGDNGVGASAQLNQPMGLALDADGSLFIADYLNFRIRKVAPNGIISTVAGNGQSAENGDGGNALQASITRPSLIAIGPNHSIYFASSDGSSLRYFGNDGIMRRVLGFGQYAGLDVAKDGSIYFTTKGSFKIFNIKVGATAAQAYGLAGGKTSTPVDSYNNGNLNINPSFLKIYDNRTLIFADATGAKVRAYNPPLPAYNEDGYSIGSRDGSEIYQFNSIGIHIQTLFAKTGGVKWKFQYDSSARLVTLIDANGNQTKINRDSGGAPVEIVGPYGQSSLVSVNQDGYLSSISNPSNEQIELGYSVGGLLSSFKRPSGGTSTFTYNSQGLLRKDIDATGATQTLEHTQTASSVTIKHLSAGGKQTIVEKIYAGGQILTRTFTPDFTLIAENQFSDRLTVSDYNSNTETRDALDTRLGGITKYPFSVLTSLNGENSSRALSISSKYVPLSQTDIFKYQQTYEYRDAQGMSLVTYSSTNKSITSKSAMGRIQSTQIDSKERPVSSVVGAFAPIQYQYNPQGQLIGLVQGTRSTQLNYNSLGQLSSVVDPAGHSVSFTYDSSNRVISQTAGDGGVTGLAYDSNGNIKTLQTPDLMAHEFISNLVDMFSVYKPPQVSNGGQTAYLYNGDKSLLKETRADGHQINYGYYMGILESINTPSRSITQMNVEGGRLKSAYSSDDITLNVFSSDSSMPTSDYSGSIAYSTAIHKNGATLNISEVYLNNSPIAYGYDLDGLITSAGSLQVGRDPQSGVISSTQLGVVATANSYNAFAEVSQISSSVSGSQVYSETLTRDSLGRIIQKVEVTASGTITYGYTYDLAGRLSDVTVNGAPSNHYSYSKSGNRLAMNAVSGSYDAQDRLLRFGDYTYSYTSTGTLLSKQKTDGSDQTLYTFDDLGQLSKVRLPDGKSIEFSIDPLVRRAVKKINGIVVQKYAYQGAQLVAVLNSDNTVKSRFVYATESHSPDYMIQAGVSYRLIKDHLGSVRIVVNASTGAVAQQLDYDEFGKVLADSNPGFQPIGFAGGLYDSDIKLIRFGARDYDADIGRWTAKDPIGFEGGDTNLYAYANSDSVNYIDPSGLKTTIRIYSSNAGHVSVQVGVGNAVGFYPSDKSQKYEYLYTSGGLKNDSDRTDISQIIELDTTLDQEQKIREYYAQHGYTDNYGLLGNNCATFAGKALKAAGIKAPTGEILPAAFGWRMRFLNGN